MTNAIYLDGFTTLPLAPEAKEARLSAWTNPTDSASREPVALTKHRKPRFVLMSYDHYERLRTGGDSRKVYRASEMPAAHVDLFEAEIDRLARGDRYGDEP